MYSPGVYICEPEGATTRFLIPSSTKTNPSGVSTAQPPPAVAILILISGTPESQCQTSLPSSTLKAISVPPRVAKPKFFSPSTISSCRVPAYLGRGNLYASSPSSVIRYTNSSDKPLTFCVMSALDQRTESRTPPKPSGMMSPVGDLTDTGTANDERSCLDASTMVVFCEPSE